MKIFEKIKDRKTGKRSLYFCGVKFFSYTKQNEKEILADKVESLKKTWITCECAHLQTFIQSSMVKELCSSSICIDCGANIGNITDIFAQSGATVHAFEPASIPFEQLDQRFSGNSKVCLYKQGCSDTAATIKLFKHENHEHDEVLFSQGNSIYGSKDNVNTADFEEIELIDLAAFIEKIGRPIDILKIDIEGAEFCVLEKLIQKELYKNIKHILVETHDETIPEIRETAARVRAQIKEKNITNINLDWV